MRPLTLARWIVPMAALAAGCSIPPKPDTPPLRDAAPLAGVEAPNGRAWPDAAWWKHYNDAGLDALEEKALAVHRGCYCLGDEFGLADLPLPRLPGRHQYDNAAAAIRAGRHQRH